MGQGIREQFVEIGSKCGICEHVFTHKDRGYARTFIVRRMSKTVCESCYIKLDKSNNIK